MCQSPQTTPDGRTFACRYCDACISARRMDWVARAMAEKSVQPFAFSITLTYADETQFQRDGAAMFRYSDVQNFMKRIRRRMEYHYKRTCVLRYIVAGEQGERNGRCHWHIILFSDIDLLTVGKFFDHRGKQVIDPSDILSETGPKSKKLRRHWDMWPHGFCTVQVPDEGGMHYALTYALKDQFSQLKAKGTARETKSETFATGLFRMSKTPAIGEPFIIQQLDELRSRRSVLPKPTLIVPDARGYWWPKGPLRKLLLQGLRAINDEIREFTGVNAPQWSSLLSACQKSDQDMEWLNGEKEIETFEEFADDFRRRANLREADKATEQVRRKCGSNAACFSCLVAVSTTPDFISGAIETFEGEHGFGFRYKENDPTGAKLRADQNRPHKRGVHPYCQNKQSKENKRAFPSSIKR